MLVGWLAFFSGVEEKKRGGKCVLFDTWKEFGSTVDLSCIKKSTLAPKNGHKKVFFCNLPLLSWFLEAFYLVFSNFLPAFLPVLQVFCSCFSAALQYLGSTVATS